MRQMMRNGVEVSEKLWNFPVPLRGLEIYIDAFFALSTTRDLSLKWAPIPWTAIQWYAEAYNMDGEQTLRLHYFVRIMDNHAKTFSGVTHGNSNESSEKTSEKRGRTSKTR